MEIRTILLPFTSTEGDAAAMELAFMVAQDYDAHVKGLHVRMDPRDIAPLAGEGLSGAMIEEMMEVCEKDGAKHGSEARRLFDEYCSRHGIRFAESARGTEGVSASWRSEVGREEDLVAWHGRVSDLTVISRPVQGEEKSTTEVIHAALMESGRPLLLAPQNPPTTIGRRIAIAWNGSAEAAHAVAGARAFFEKAEAIVIMTAEEGWSHGPEAADLAAYLSWYDLHPEIRRFGDERDGIGASLLARIADYGADMLVMGAYTHSRLRHLILGGVTSHVVSHAELPVLMYR